MSLNQNTYVECPYCPMRYKHDNKVNRDAIAGHINLKHKDKPQVMTGADYEVVIPNKLPPGTVVEVNEKLAVVLPEKGKSLEEPSNKVLPLVKSDIELEGEAMFNKQKEEKAKRKAELEQQLKQLENEKSE